MPLFLHLRGTRGQSHILSVPSLDPCLSTWLLNGASICRYHHHYHLQVKWSKKDRTLGLPLLPQRNQTTFYELSWRWGFPLANGRLEGASEGHHLERGSFSPSHDLPKSYLMVVNLDDVRRYLIIAKRLKALAAAVEARKNTSSTAFPHEEKN